MMAKTHITVGIASALAVCRPSTPGGLLAAVIGGTVGGILCDIECRSEPGMRDALIGRIIAFVITAVLLFTDRMMHFGIVESISSRNKIILAAGVLLLLITCIKGRASEHRTFTHSLLYVLLFSMGFYCITPLLMIPVFCGGLSHLVIDTFNKKNVPWLYPIDKKGFCFRLCYASKTGNTVLMWSGLAAAVGLLVWRVILMGKL